MIQNPDGALYEFEQSISGMDDEIDLARAALLIAKIEYADLEVEAILDSLNALAARAQARFSGLGEPEQQVDALNSVMIEDLGLRGARKNYYDPRNSYINEVLERKVGIPVSLSILYMSVGARAGMALAGTAVPMHFLVRVLGVEPVLFVDVYSKGRVHTEEQVVSGIQRISMGRVNFRPEMLQTVSNRAVLNRLLTNLKMIYLNAMKFSSAEKILDRIILANPAEPSFFRERGLVRFKLGNSNLARRDLEQYLDQDTEPSDADEIRRLLRKIG